MTKDQRDSIAIGRPVDVRLRRLGDLVMAEEVVDRFGDEAGVRIVMRLPHNLLIAGMILMIDQELRQRPCVPIQIGIRINLMQRTGADAGAIVVVRRLLNPKCTLAGCLLYLSPILPQPFMHCL